MYKIISMKSSILKRKTLFFSPFEKIQNEHFQRATNAYVHAFSCRFYS